MRERVGRSWLGLATERGFGSWTNLGLGRGGRNPDVPTLRLRFEPRGVED